MTNTSRMTSNTSNTGGDAEWTQVQQKRSRSKSAADQDKVQAAKAQSGEWTRARAKSGGNINFSSFRSCKKQEEKQNTSNRTPKTFPKSSPKLSPKKSPSKKSSPQKRNIRSPLKLTRKLALEPTSTAVVRPEIRFAKGPEDNAVGFTRQFTRQVWSYQQAPVASTVPTPEPPNNAHFPQPESTPEPQPEEPQPEPVVELEQTQPEPVVEPEQIQPEPVVEPAQTQPEPVQLEKESPPAVQPVEPTQKAPVKVAQNRTPTTTWKSSPTKKTSNKRSAAPVQPSRNRRRNNCSSWIASPIAVGVVIAVSLVSMF